MATTSAKMGPGQALILSTLAKWPMGLTVEKLEEKAGVPVTPNNIGPITVESLVNHPDSLYARKLVRPVKPYEDEPYKWVITDAGKKLAEKVKGRKIGAKDKVDNDILDTAVVKFRTTRAYGMENWTDADIREVRGMLGSAYEMVELDDLKNQILARRKQGAYADPKEKFRKACERAIREFGPHGTIIKELLTEDQITTLCEKGGIGDESE